MSGIIEGLIREDLGDRCPDFDPDCPCCRAWGEYDDINRLRARLRSYVGSLHCQNCGTVTNTEELTCHCTGSEGSGDPPDWKPFDPAWSAELTRLRAERDNLREAIRVVVEDGAPREVAEVYRDDGVPSKHDKCIHKSYGWESCDGCTDEFLAAALKGTP